MKKVADYIFVLGGAIIVTLVFIFGLWLLGKTTDIFRKPVTSPPTAATTTPPTFPHLEFDSLSEFKKLVLLSKEKSYTPGGDVKSYSHTRFLQPSGEFSKMYLYTEISFNGGKLTGARDLYVKFKNFGGHIKNKPLPVPDSLVSRLLYDADNIQYVETITNPNIAAVSWLDIFNDAAGLKKPIRFDTFVSSREEAWIEKIELYYQCSRETECSIVEVR